MTEAVRAAGPRSLVVEVQDLANRVHHVASGAGRPELSERLVVEAGRYRAPDTSIVVVGEQGRGKTALINALLDAPGLLPVGSDAVTNVHVAVTGGSPGVSVERETQNGGLERVEVGLDEVARWTTERENPDNRDGVRSVTVRVDHPLLRDGLVLIDTPGVGGLDRAHTATTVATVAAADALLFVADASTPITASEVAFLEDATHRIDTVLFALTKIDASRGWATIQVDDADLIAKHAPSLSGRGFLPVSTRYADLAAKAEAEGDIDTAARARAESGLEDLRAAVRHDVLDRGSNLRLANLVRLTQRVISQLAERAQLQVADESVGAEHRQRLDDEQARLRVLAEQSARWRVDLDGELRRLSLDFDGELEFAFATLDREMEARITRASLHDLVEFGTELADALDALWINVTLYVRDQVVRLADGLATSLDLEGVGVDVDDLRMPERIAELIEARAGGTDDESASAKFLNYYPVVFAGSGVSMVAANFSNLGLATIAGGPLVLLSGAAMAGMFTVRRSIARKAHGIRDANRALKTALPHARSAIAKQFAGMLIEIRRNLESDVARRLDERRVAIEQTVRDQQARLQEDETARERRRADATREGSELHELATTARGLIARLSEVPS